MMGKSILEKLYLKLLYARQNMRDGLEESCGYSNFVFHGKLLAIDEMIDMVENLMNNEKDKK